MCCSLQKGRDAVIGARDFDRDAALEAAMVLFWRKGFATTSMNDLCDAMGVRSPSLYAPSAARRRSISKRSSTTSGPGTPGLGQACGRATARTGIEKLLIADRSLPKSRATTAGCMAVLAGRGDEWPGRDHRVVKKVRPEMLGCCARGWKLQCQRRTARLEDINA